MLPSMEELTMKPLELKRMVSLSMMSTYISFLLLLPPLRVFMRVMGVLANIDDFVVVELPLIVWMTAAAMLGLATSIASLCTQFFSNSVDVICG